MSIGVYVASLDVDALAKLLDELEAAVVGAIVERPDALKFLSPPAHRNNWVAWPSGRTFGLEVELTWETGDSGVDVRYTGATPPSDFKSVLSLEELNQESLWYYLWGPGDVVIGGRLDYALLIQGGGRPRLKVVEYRDAAGRLRYYRYQDVQPREGEENDG